MSFVMVRNLTIAVCAFAAPLAARAAPPAPTPEPTSYPSLRPNTPLPEYPAASRRHKEAGVVKVALCVDATGKVTKADMAQSSGFPNLDKAVVKWIVGLQVNPALAGATPVAVCDIPFSYEFKVTKAPTQPPTRTTNPFDVGPASHP
jgi:protein TonB